MANQSLIEGAGLVAGTERAGKLSASHALTQTGAFIAQGTALAIKDKNKEFNQNLQLIMQKELARDPGLSNAEYRALFKKYNKKRFEYVFLNKKDRMLALRDIDRDKVDYTSNENLKKNIAGLISSGELGEDIWEKLGLNANDVGNIVDGKKELVTKGDEKGYMITNPEANKYSEMSFSEAFKANRDANMAAHGMNYSKWTNFMWPGSRSNKKDGVWTEYYPYTDSDLGSGASKGGGVKFQKEVFKNINEVENLVESNKIDLNSKEGVNALMNAMIEKASNLKPGENANFNFQQVFSTIRSSIVENADLKSLFTDGMFAGRAFKKDIEEALVNGTYADWGLSNKLVRNLDPTDNGRVTQRDARRIIRAIRQDEDLLKNIITGYFTKAIEQNWNNSLSQEVKDWMEANPGAFTTTTTPTNQTTTNKSTKNRPSNKANKNNQQNNQKKEEIESTVSTIEDIKFDISERAKVNHLAWRHNKKQINDGNKSDAVLTPDDWYYYLGSKDEGNAVARFNELYGEDTWGFKAEGGKGSDPLDLFDAVKITAPNGETKTWDWDPGKLVGRPKHQIALEKEVLAWMEANMGDRDPVDDPDEFA